MKTTIFLNIKIKALKEAGVKENRIFSDIGTSSNTKRSGLSLLLFLGDNYHIWSRNWQGIIPFLSFLDYIRKAVYTTNAIEVI
jgi:hypothetical protein